MTGLTRRELLVQGAIGARAIGLEVPSRSAAVPADRRLRVTTIGYDLFQIPSLAQRAKRDIGVEILTELGSTYQMNRWVRQQPAAFDILDGFSFLVDPDWATGNLQPIEIAKVERWRQISPLLKHGRLRPGDRRCAYGEGDAAFRRLYLDPDRSGRWKSPVGAPRQLEGLLVEWTDERTGRPVGPEPRFCTGVPTAFNFDSFGYNARVVRKQPQQLSWAELLNGKWRGRVGVIADPLNGFQDTGNAARAARLVRIRDLGAPTRREIDALIKLLIVLKRRKHFHGFWWEFSDAKTWMRSGSVVIGSMYALTISLLQAVGFPVRQAAPREGYRAFAGMFSISSAVTDPAKLRACYDFINWWSSGFAGSMMLRFGYFNAVEATARRFMDPDEYAYWLHGKPAAEDYKAPSGDKVVRAGSVRDGGPFARRACRIASWNSWPAETEHLLGRWYDLLNTR